MATTAAAARPRVKLSPAPDLFDRILSVASLLLLAAVLAALWRGRGEWSARTHNHRQHRNTVRGMVTGALIIAGAFTFRSTACSAIGCSDRLSRPPWAAAGTA